MKQSSKRKSQARFLKGRGHCWMKSSFTDLWTSIQINVVSYPLIPAPQCLITRIHRIFLSPHTHGLITKSLEQLSKRIWIPQSLFLMKHKTSTPENGVIMTSKRQKMPKNCSIHTVLKTLVFKSFRQQQLPWRIHRRSCGSCFIMPIQKSLI